MTEHEWDQKLNIQTIGRDDKHADQFHHPYEPTPYCVLERLGDNSGMLDELYFLDEIDCKDLFDGNDEREKIMIFELG